MTTYSQRAPFYNAISVTTRSNECKWREQKSTGNDLDYAVDSRMARRGTVFQSQTQHWSCKAAHEQYNAGLSELKSLLQNTPEEEKDAQANVGSGPRMSFCDGCPGSERGQGIERMVVLETIPDE